MHCTFKQIQLDKYYSTGRQNLKNVKQRFKRAELPHQLGIADFFWQFIFHQKLVLQWSLVQQCQECGEIPLPQTASTACLPEKLTWAAIVHFPKTLVALYRVTWVVCKVFHSNQTNSLICLTFYWSQSKTSCWGLLTTPLPCRGPGLLCCCSWRYSTLQSPSDLPPINCFFTSAAW